MLQLVLPRDRIAVLYFLVYLSQVSVASSADNSSNNIGAGGVTQLKEVVVTAEKDQEDIAPLPDVEGTKIYAGKKTSTVALEEAPPIVNNNYREAFEKTPGLLVSEESTPLVSIGYRGLNPDRAQFMQVLKDGIPIQADIFGYPEAYYTPPFQVVDHIDFIRGGSALMYGPQPGGAINFVTKDPYEGSFHLVTENSFGSHDLFSTYSSLSGTQGSFGHYSYFHHRQSQGFRDFNSQYEVYYGGSKVIIDQDPTTRWTIAFDLYEEEHGEPGGLTRADFDTNASLSTRLSDRFELERNAGSLGYRKEISDDTFFEGKIFGGSYGRFSWRQRGGGFGTIPTGANASTNDIQEQEFFTGGADLRLRRTYDGWSQTDHALSAGFFYYHSTSPRREKRGVTGDAEDGPLRKESDRTTNYVSFFLENIFRFGALSVTPGVRLENIWQGIEEKLNLDKTTVPLADESDYDFVPLFGVGAEYHVTDKIDLYANVSESYRPKVYADAVPLGTNQVVSGDLEEGNSWQAEGGVRGRLVSYLSWDVSVFRMEFEDQTGTVVNTITNVGDAEYDGAEFATSFGVSEWLDSLCGSKNVDEIGAFNVFYNLTYLDSEFVAGPNAGKTPQLAPDYLMRGGVEYRFRDRVKVRLGGTFLDDHFGDDSNSEQRVIPSYKVWDLTAEAKLYKDVVKVFGGVNNLFDEHYFARVTGTGIDPADGRNYYLGVNLAW